MNLINKIAGVAEFVESESVMEKFMLTLLGYTFHAKQSKRCRWCSTHYSQP